MKQVKQLGMTIIKQEAKSIKIIKDYPDFNEFYLENKQYIYDSIIEVFTKFVGNSYKSLSLNIDAKIKGLDWKSNFEFSVEKDLELLMKDILPLYVEKEDYEKCSNIKKLYLLLKNRNDTKK